MEELRRECEDLHANIQYGLDIDIDRIIKEFPNEKYFYNDKGESAAAVALKHKQIKIYESLISKGICLGSYENANEITKGFDPRMKQIIREINKKNSIKVADHISILMSKSKISHNAFEGEVIEMDECIRKAFIDLDQIARMKPILLVIAYADKLSITFDFYDHKISNMDPTKGHHVRGCCYPTGRCEGDVYIGAKGLMRAGKEYLEALGTLAHELSHYAMQILYQNHCKPFNSQDNEKAFGEPAEKLRKAEDSGKDQEAEEESDEKLFNDICKQCEEYCEAEDSEPCINVVFQYPETQRHAELIVRVPQLLVLHKNDEEKLSQIESTYFELFNFFEEKMLSNIESVLPRIKSIYRLNHAYQSKHHTIEYYVERKFIRLDANFEKISGNPLTEDQLVDHTENDKILLLSDEPGAGKTTNLNAMTGKLKQRYPDHWIVVIDLKGFAECYKRDGDESTTFSTISDIVNYYCEKIFKFKNFEAKNFAELFEDNRVMFLMDGFDEISPSYKEFNLKLITAITRESDNRIWISTRPHLERELQDKLNCSVFRLSPFTIDDRRKFLEFKWKSEILDKKMLNETIEKVENILDGITEKSEGLDPTSNPLILTMISEILDDLPNQTMNLYSIYETFVNKKMKIFFKKGPEAEEQMTDPHGWLNINVYHHEIALVTVLDLTSDSPVTFGRTHDFRYDFWPKLCGRTTCPSSEEIARLGLMVYADNSKTFHFIHRTFAEYFVADFIIESLSKFKILDNYGTQKSPRGHFIEKLLILSGDSKEVDTETILDDFLYFVLNADRSRKSLTMVRHFIYSFWKTRSRMDSSRNKKLQKFEKALNSSGRFFENLFHAALSDGSDCWLKDVPKALEETLRSVEFWKPWEYKENSVMMLSAKHSASFFSEYLEFINKSLDLTTWREIFLDVDEKKESILYYCSSETFKLILSDWSMIPMTRQEKKELLQAKNANGLNVLLFYITCKSKGEFEKYYEIVKDFDERMPEILLQDSIDIRSRECRSILHYCFLMYRDYSSKYRLDSSLEIIRKYFELSSIKELFNIKDCDCFLKLLGLFPG